MTENQKNEIIESGKNYFRATIIPNHLKNLNGLTLKSFNINPFIINYHFKHLINKARIDKLSINIDDLIVGILYGEGELTSFYKTINAAYPVYCGAEFWEHLTGDQCFYNRLAKAFGEVVEEDNIDGSYLIMNKIEEIAKEIEDKGGI